MFMVSAPGPALVRHDATLLGAMRTAGVRKGGKLSAIGTVAGSWHHPGEEALRAGGTGGTGGTDGMGGMGGMVWTILRPSSFASNALRWAPEVRAGRPVPNTTGDGAQGVVDPRDVAAVAVRVLTTERYDGRVLTLTGPELLSLPDQVARVGVVLGRRLSTVEVSLTTYRQSLLNAGIDPGFADVAVDGARTVAEGGNAVLTEDVEEVLGRAASGVTEWVRDHRAAFA